MGSLTPEICDPFCMVDATPLTTPASLTAASRTATADKLFKILDPNNTGKIQKADFLELYSMLGNGSAKGGPQTDSFGIAETTYSIQETSYNIAAENFGAPDRFLETSSAAVVHAANVFSSLDTDKSGTLSRAEFMTGLGAGPETPAPDPVPTPTMPVDPTAQDPAVLFTHFDSNKDGSLDASEIAAANGTSASADSSQTLKAWDTTGDGRVSQPEFTDGFNLIKQATGIIAQYDTAGKGYFDQADLQAAIDANPTNTTSAADLMKFWDSNGDGKVTVPEVLAGLAAGGTAASTPDASTPVPSATPDPVPDVSNLLSAYGYSTAPVTPANDAAASQTPVSA